MNEKSNYFLCHVFLLESLDLLRQNFFPSVLPHIQKVLKCTLQISYKFSIMTVLVLQRTVPLSPVSQTHLSLGQEKKKIRILSSVSRRRHRVKTEKPVVFNITIFVRLRDMGRTIALAILSKIWMAVKSLLAKPCIQASEQGEGFSHLPNREQVLLLVDIFHEYVYLSIRFRYQCTDKLYLEPDLPSFLKERGLQ